MMPYNVGDIVAVYTCLQTSAMAPHQDSKHSFYDCWCAAKVLKIGQQGDLMIESHRSGMLRWATEANVSLL